MKQRHKAGACLDAREILRACNIDPTGDQDFYTLRASQVDALLEHADRERYQKPRDANGSRGRYYYARLQRFIRANR